MSNIKKVIITIIVIALLAIIIWFIYEGQKPDTLNTNTTQNIVKNPNEGLENWIDEISTETNVQSGELKENEEPDPPTTENSSEVVPESTFGREEKAKQLVIARWGDMEGFYLSMEGMEADGKYRITIHDEMTTAKKVTYFVDVDTEEVTEE